jgi:hypothetical protein
MGNWSMLTHRLLWHRCDTCMSLDRSKFFVCSKYANLWLETVFLIFSLREFGKFCTCRLDPENILCGNFFIFYFKMNGENWIESQKQRLLDNSEAHGEFGCLLCKLGRFSTKFVFFEPTWPFYLKFNLSKTIYFLKRTWFLYVLSKFEAIWWIYCILTPIWRIWCMSYKY